ncbi:T9SS type A sorting domain-containing protein [Halocola ammonii]
MKALFTLALTFAISFISNAQQFSWELDFDSSISVNEMAVGQSESAYFISATKYEEDNDFRNTVLLTKANLDGEIIWSKQLATADEDHSVSVHDMEVTIDGNCFLVGEFSLNNQIPRNPFVLATDADGNILWNRKIDYSLTSDIKIDKLGDGTMLLTFTYFDDGQHRLFCKMNTEGTFSNEKTLNSTQHVPWQVLANETDFEVLFHSGNLMNISNDLNTTNWQKKYFHEIGMVFNRAANGDFIFASATTAFPGYASVFRTDPNGNLIWIKHIETWLGSTQSQTTIFDIVGFHFIHENELGEIVVCANSEGGLVGSMNLVFDGSGNYLRNFKIFEYRHRIELTSDDQFALIGFTNQATLNTHPMVFESRISSVSYPCDTSLSHSISIPENPELEPDSIVFSDAEELTHESVKLTSSAFSPELSQHCDFSITVDEIYQSPELSAYPNPTSGFLTVNTGNSGTSAIEIFDCYGKCVLLRKKLTATCELNLSFLSAGIYFLEVTSEEGKTQVKKIVIAR